MNKDTLKWETIESDDIVLKVRDAQIHQLYRQTWTGLTGVLVIALSVCVVLWQVIPHWKLLWWVGMSALLTIARGFLTATFQRKSPSGSDSYHWAKLHVIGVIASGLLWAFPSFFLWPGEAPLHQLVWPICIMPLASVSVAAYCTWTPSYISFLLLSAVPVSIRLLTEGDLLHVILGLLGFLFTAILAHTGKVMHAHSLHALIVGIRNEALSSVLSEEKETQEELNLHLQQEMSQRKRSQEELQLRNQELEQLNTQLTTTKSYLESTNSELKNALTNVKQLSGLLPICASCKKIRNDKGYWEQIEGYVRDHSEAQFSHGICPGCVKTLYSDLYNDS